MRCGACLRVHAVFCMHDFQRLQVWQKARALFVAIDGVTRTFPRSDRGVIATQLRRSAFSIPANIAEGCGKTSPRETVRFMQIAAGSVTETESHILLATELGYFHPKTGDDLLRQVVAIRRMLFRLSQSLAERPPTSGG
jgi:four helix bundle protein